MKIKYINRFLNADSGAEGGEGAESTEPTKAPEQKFFTQDEINKMIEDRLSRERKKFDSEKEKIEKLSKMTAEEKAEEARREQEQKMQEYIAKAERLEAKQFAQEELAKYGLTNSFADFVMNNDKEMAVANIKLLKNAFDTAVQAKVKEMLASNGSTPQQPKVEGDIKPKAKMTLAEMQKLYEQNPDAFK